MYREQIKLKFFKISADLYLYKAPLLVYNKYLVRTPNYINSLGRKSSITQIYVDYGFHLVNPDRDTKEGLDGFLESEYKKTWWLVKKNI